MARGISTMLLNIANTFLYYIMYKDYELLCRLESHEVPRRIKDNNVMNVLLCNPQQVSVYGIELFCIVAYC